MSTFFFDVRSETKVGLVICMKGYKLDSQNNGDINIYVKRSKNVQ